MKAVILAAGEGKRMHPLTYSMPKAMIPIAGKPIMEYGIEACKKCGIKDFVFVVGYGRQKVQNYFQDGLDWGINIEYVIQEKQLGTGHALKQARNVLKGEREFLVMNGDSLMTYDAIRDLLSEKPPALLATTAEDPSKYGIVRIENGYLKDIVEKPQMPESNIVNTGAYILTDRIFDVMDRHPGKENNVITDLLKYMILEGKKIRGVLTSNIWRNAIYPWDLLCLNSIAAGMIKYENKGNVGAGAQIIGDVKIGKGTIIHPNTYIAGPVIIGEGCEIGPNSVISPVTSIGDNVMVSPFCEISESIVMDDVRIGTGSIIHSSIIGKGVKAGMRLSADSGEANVRIDEEWHHIALLGAIIGEDTNIEDNVTIKPGSIIGAKCRIGRDKYVRFLPDNTVVI